MYSSVSGAPATAAFLAQLVPVGDSLADLPLEAALALAADLALAGAVLAIAVVAGYGLLDGVDREGLAWPLGFAGGAVASGVAGGG